MVLYLFITNWWVVTMEMSNNCLFTALVWPLPGEMHLCKWDKLTFVRNIRYLWWRAEMIQLTVMQWGHGERRRLNPEDSLGCVRVRVVLHSLGTISPQWARCLALSLVLWVPWLRLHARPSAVPCVKVGAPGEWLPGALGPQEWGPHYTQGFGVRWV